MKPRRATRRDSETFLEPKGETLGGDPNEAREPPRRVDKPVPRPIPQTEDQRDEVLSSDDLTMGQSYDSLIDSFFEFEPQAAYERIIAHLRLTNKASRTEHGILLDHLDDARDVAHLAIRLLANARASLKAYEIDCEVLENSIRREAREGLEREKKAGTRTKAVTDKDVGEAVSDRYHDEWRSLNSQRSRAKEWVNHLEALAKEVSLRGNDLRQMVATTSR